MKWSIVTDSSCEYIGINTDTLTFEKVPFVLSISGVDYIDDASIDLDEMMDAMEKSPEASHSSCPGPGLWEEKFLQADCVIAITISIGVSGSYNSAQTARKMVLAKHPDKKIYVLDSRSAGSGPNLFACKAEELINRGGSFEEIEAELKAYEKIAHTVFALSSFGNLVKNGRMSRLAGMLAGKLGFWGIGGVSEEGTIITLGKARGPIRMMAAIVDHMKENGYRSGEIVITHCRNAEMAQKLKERIREVWANAPITILTTGGLCSYYAERGGLIVAYAE